MKIEIVRNSEDLLTCQKWGFWVNSGRWDEIRVILDTYTETKRPTKRHGWKLSGVYNRIMHRNNTIKVDEVAIPEDVAAEARVKIINSIVVMKHL